VGPQQVAQFAGLAGGGVWLDRGGRLLALDHVRQGGRRPVVRSVALDLVTGVLSPLLELAPGSNDRLVAADPRSGLIIVRSDAAGEDRLGWGVLGVDQPLRFPDCLHRPQRFLRPVAIEPPADPATPAAELRVALQGDWGATSSLALWRPAEGRCEPLPLPAGRMGGLGHWSRGGLRIPYSAPDHPAGMATIDVDRLREDPPDERPTPTMPLRLAPLQGGSAGMNSLLRRTPKGAPVRELRPNHAGWRLDGSSAPSEGGRWHPARTCELPGAAGRLEAVVYGGDSWLTMQHLVLALHGGPADAWRMEFDPTLQRMAAEGLAVVAPNQRGSTGYGVEHAQALQDAWGGPDLDDVLALLSSISGHRVALGLEPASLFGVSYGAFLALLAACSSPALVARCAVVAPFLSGARLSQEAAPGVRSLTERLGGAQEPGDGRGPRDVLRLCHRLTAPLLVVHGDQDEVVPVGQSRTLREELLRMGRSEGADFRYVEAAGAGHEVLAEESGPVLNELLASFLRTGRAT
jgi:pimeloyl-ACP methyl ester carboxylesterase